MPFYVKRTRIQDRPGTPLDGSRIGEIAYSNQNHPSRALADQEAASWLATGSWTCEVVEGLRPPLPSARKVPPG